MPESLADRLRWATRIRRQRERGLCWPERHRWDERYVGSRREAECMVCGAVRFLLLRPDGTEEWW